MAAHSDAVLERWARQWRQRGVGEYVAALVEALEPLAPAGAVLLQGGRWLFSPWMNEETLQAATLLLEDDEQRARFLRGLISASGEHLP